MKRRHANRNELAWKKTEIVRYFVQISNQRHMGYVFDTSQPDVLERACDEGVKDGAYLEVTASDLPYLEKPEGDWEFRKANDDYYIPIAISFIDGKKHKDMLRSACGVSSDAYISGYRWCKPRKVTCPHCNGTGEI